MRKFEVITGIFAGISDTSYAATRLVVGMVTESPDPEGLLLLGREIDNSTPLPKLAFSDVRCDLSIVPFTKL